MSRMAPSTMMPPSRWATAVRHINSPKTALVVLPGGHDDDVAGLGDLQGLVNHQIVGGPAVHGDRGPQSGSPLRGWIRGP